MKSVIVIFVVLMFLQVAYAAGGASPDGIPWGFIGTQAFNFGLLLAVIIYFAKDTIKEIFRERLSGYLEESERAEKEMKAAQAKKQDWLEKISKLEATSEESIQVAKSESQTEKERALKEAGERAQQLKTEAEKSIQVAIEKSKSELRKELLAESMGSARGNLESSVDQPLNKELNNKFFEKMKVVQ